MPAPTRTTQEDNQSLGQLLERFQQGDHSAFDAFAERIDPAILAVSRRVLSDAHLAEDARQETLLRVWQQMSVFDPDGSAGGWTTTIAFHEAVGQHRSRSRFRRAEQLAWDGRPGSADCCRGGACRLDDEDVAEIRELVEGLPEALRLPIQMFYFENASLREIAERCAVPIGTVGSRLYRARHRLRRAVLDRHAQSA